MIVQLHHQVVGSGRPVALVHGFTQTGRSWGHVVDALSNEYRLTTVDAPGHGGSSAVRSNLVVGADQIGRTCGRAIYIGYSMGARFCLHLAVQAPELVKGLVLVSGTPGIIDDAERAARRTSDELLAERIEAIGVERFVDEWLRNPLFASLPDDPADRADRATNTAAGLASSLRLAGTGTQVPLWDGLSVLTMPILVLAGERDAKFADIGRQMVSAIGPTSTFATIPAAGHAAHLEQPQRFLDVLRPWLSNVPA